MRAHAAYEFAARSLMPDLWAMGLFAGEGNIDVRTYVLGFKRCVPRRSAQALRKKNKQARHACVRGVMSCALPLLPSPLLHGNAP